MIFHQPEPSPEDIEVLGEIHASRGRLADVLRTPRRWQGGLRRTMLARAIRGSNSIEGYDVEIDDAAAALDDDAPLSADQQTFAEIRGYRQALGYVLQMAADPHFVLDQSAIRSMHFMMLSHAFSKSPGQYRSGPIYVRDDHDDRVVYEGPDARLVPELVNELVDGLRHGDGADPIVRAAMAHLNLVMIHPFRDGNGRMARALQTLVLAREEIVEPSFSSVEEWLGENTEHYYRVLAATGQGHWQPANDATPWMRFMLRAHHMQAQTAERRLHEAASIWEMLDQLVSMDDLPERVTELLYEAVLGYRLRRSTYLKQTGLEERTATRDLSRLVDVGLLETRGATRGRYYVAAGRLHVVRAAARASREPLHDPYPELRAEPAR